MIKAKTLLNVSRVKDLDFDVLSLKSPWVENPMMWHKILKIWQNYRRNLRQLEERLEKEIFKLRVGDELQQGVMKLAKVYERVQRWIQIYKGTKSPSEMNIAQETLREIEELTLRVDNGFFKSIPPDIIKKLNQYWKQYKY